MFSRNTLYKIRGSCCCAVGCSMRSGCNNVSEIKMHRFPKDEPRRTAWINAVGRKKWEPTAATRLCSLHFITRIPSKDPNSPDWKPTLFTHKSISEAQIKQKNARYNRWMQRQMNTAVIPTITTVDKSSEDCNSHVELNEDIEDNTCTVQAQNGLNDLSQATCEVITNSVSTQTCSSWDELILENKMLTKKLQKVESFLAAEKQHKNIVKDLLDETISDRMTVNETEMKFFTGLTITMFFNLITLFKSFWKPTVYKKMSMEEQFALVLMKLRLGLLNEDLAFRFKIPVSTVSKIFHEWLDIMHRNLSFLIRWPSRTEIKKTLPDCLKDSYFNGVRCIIDCTEVPIEKPSNYTARSQTYSNYKGRNTVKFLVAISPNGCISFLSQTWGGRISDKELTKNSGFTKLLEPGDVVLADRGFQITDLLACKSAKLLVPASTRGKNQLSGSEVIFSRKMSMARVHVERAIRRMKTYKILSSTLPISLIKKATDNQFATIDKIMTVVGALCNLKNDLIASNFQTN